MQISSIGHLHPFSTIAHGEGVAYRTRLVRGITGKGSGDGGLSCSQGLDGARSSVDGSYVFVGTAISYAQQVGVGQGVDETRHANLLCHGICGVCQTMSAAVIGHREVVISRTIGKTATRAAGCDASSASTYKGYLAIIIYGSYGFIGTAISNRSVVASCRAQCRFSEGRTVCGIVAVLGEREIGVSTCFSF